jgi:methyl-accepting chemotaxis protein
MKEFSKFQKEVKAELELMWGSQSSSGKRIEAMARSLEEQGQAIIEQGQTIADQGQAIAEQGQAIAEQGQAIARQAVRIDASMRHTAGIAREVVALGDQMVGRLRQLDDKFGKFLGALERETVSSKSFRALEERVRRLEQKDGSAA